MSSRLALYDRVAEEVASVVIRKYSTSFGLASRLLGPDVRQHVENIYALVRVADEIVDGPATEAGLDTVLAGRSLNELERETEHAMETGFSANLVVHAFALTAREVGFGSELTAPFFDSMRADLTETVHDQASFDTYVYGSAEVVGLMCLAAFLKGEQLDEQQHAEFTRGARALGAAFQKVNFLRDLAADFETLGRSYFPGIRVDSFTEQEKHRLLDDIDHDLAVSAAVVPKLPASSRRAVALAQSLFAELSVRLRATPASDLVRARVRVPNPVKARLALVASLGGMPKA
ncbi:phytoene synthase [Microbacteriaceae bacterium SG_E_30_P1]|uniref:Phytoene synthase n=1 Tax=Antiquaquibacter oligotrophicus TaxID=2880260 RepID=A0ABT6KTF0_9MICO|nr:squalene/phytoene synthase family protein [Antiquaquibacter oligotrophicus]MDH6182469.1 phytoene synthase [Antiquaquibacter oligotrophicus]UDF14560.1 squalene/phytoene synthase family protein [Antiquaquibacter oligotrophicus]